MIHGRSLRELLGIAFTTREYLLVFFALGYLVVIIALLFVIRAEDKGSLGWWLA